MEFEPDECRQRIMTDGVVELAVTYDRYMIHVKLSIPLYGNIWVMADNEGEGYTGDFVDFVSEAVRTYVQTAKEYGKGIVLSADAQWHLDAVIEFSHLADRGKSTPENRLYPLSHAVYTAEAALFQAVVKKVYASHRSDLLLGCSFFRYTSPTLVYKVFCKSF